MVELQDIFDVTYGNKLDLNKMNQDVQEVNFIGRSAKKNGVTSKVKRISDIVPYSEGCITVALGGSVLSSFLQPTPFYTGQNVAVLQQKEDIELTDIQKLFYCKVIYSNAYRFSACGREANRTLKYLKVPSIDKIPEWVDSLDVDKYSGACEPLVANDFKFDLDFNNWKSFRIDDLFTIKKGKRLTKANMTDGHIPFIGATDSNNGLTAKVGQVPIHEGNVITVNYNGSVGEAFYQPSDFWASDDVNVLYPKNEKFDHFNQYIALFIIPLIKLNKYRFNYGRKWHKERMEETTLMLPVTDNDKLDIKLMEEYIKSLKFSSSIA